MGRTYRGMVLAAGLGTRLAPLTDLVPKPLVSIGPERLIESAIRRLVRAGIVEIAVNLHHLPEQIPEALGTGEALGARLTYFDEREILGTAGGLRNAAEFLGTGPFLVVNSDMVTDVEVEPMLRHHEASGALITLGLRAEDVERYGSLLVDEAGRVVDIRGRLGVPSEGHTSMHFMGLQICEPEVLALIPEGKSETPGDVWLPLLRERGPGVIAAWRAGGYFSDVGTWERLLETHRERLLPHHPSLSPDIRIHEPVHVDATATLIGPVELGPAVTLGPGVVVRGPATLSDLIALPDSRIAPGEWRRGVVCGDRFIQSPS